MKISEIQLTYKRVVLNQNGEALNASAKVNTFIREYLKAVNQDLTLRECFFAAFFDTALNCIGVLKVADGGIDAVHVDPRLIYSTAVNTGCKGVMLFHNHPSGYPDNQQNKSRIKHARYTIIWTYHFRPFVRKLLFVWWWRIFVDLKI